MTGFALSPQQERRARLSAAGVGLPEQGTVTLLLTGLLDPDRLAAALADLARRHEILRTRFPTPPGLALPVQEIGEEAVFNTELSGGEGSWLLTLRLPALALDRVGAGILLADLAAAYRGDTSAEPLQYADLAPFLTELAASSEAEEGRAFFARLAASTPASERPPTPFSPRRFGVPLPDLRVSSCGAAPSDFLLTAWRTLLARTAPEAGEPNSLLAVAAEGRSLEGLERVPGLLALHLPIELPYVPAAPFSRACEETRRAKGEVLAWQHAFPSGGDALPRFGFDARLLPPPARAGDLVLDLVSCEVFHERFAAELVVEESREGLRAELIADEAALAPHEAAVLAARLAVLTASAARHPERPVGDLEFLAEAERQQVLVEANDSARRLPPSEPFLAGFFAAVGEAPDRVAIEAPAETLTFGATAVAVDRLAGRLRAMGVGPEVRVGVSIAPSPGMVLALAGVTAAGGAFVPIDPALPAGRRETLRRHSRPALVLVGAESAATEGGDVSLSALLAAGVEETRPAAPPEDALAYVLYTSGSTGEPKGVMVPRRAIANRLHWMQAEFPLGAGDAVLQRTSLSFDAALWEVFLPLLAGARLVLPEPGADLSGLVRRAAGARVTVLQLVPSLVRPWLDELPPTGMPDLARLFCGGEALPAATLRRLGERSAARGINLYGPTECAIDVAFCDPSPGETADPLPLGGPIANLALFVVDARLQPLPVGAPGELVAAGVGLGRGYLDLPAPTAERFVPSPFANGEPGARLYRTGDRAVRRPDGSLLFLGRLDAQVKVRGVRVEPGEVEAVLAALPAVAQVAVVVTGGAAGPALTAFLVPRPAPPPGWLEEARVAVATALPAAFVPARFVELSDLPRLPNGKLDRKALAALPAESAGPAPEAAARPEGSWLAALVREVLAGVLEVPAVAPGDGFLALGGHSLSAMKAVARLRRAAGVDLPVRDFLEAPTVAELTRRIEERLAAGRPELPPLVPLAEEGGEVPLSFAQQRLWFLDRLEPGAATYNVGVALEIDGPLEPAALAAAVTAVVRRHAALRTSLPERDGRPRQEVAPPPAEVALPQVDLGALPPEAARREARALSARLARIPFDLAAGPLLSLLLIRLGERSHRLGLAVHHTVADGWSAGIFLGELAALYAAARERRGDPLPLPPVRYADYAAWQRHALTGPALERRLAFWREALAGAPPPPELPADRRSPGPRRSAGLRRRAGLPAATSAAWRRLARTRGATLFMALLAGWAAWLHRVTGAGDLVIGSPVANRGLPETERVIGLFVNLLPLRLAADPAAGLDGWLVRTRAACLAASPFEDLPFERLAEELRPERQGLATPFFDTVLAVQDPPPAVVWPGLNVTPEALDTGTAKFALTLDLTDGAEGLYGSLEGSSELFDATTVERFVRQVARLLEAWSEAPEIPAGELPLLDEAEVHQAVHEWGDAHTAWAAGVFPRRFFAQAETRPDAVALAAGGGLQVTYGDLARATAARAAHLRRLGAGPEVRVALIFERGLERVAAILAVLAAGAAYVPLEPDLPEHRRRFVLSDSGAALAVVEKGEGGGLSGFAGRVVPWASLPRDGETPPSLPEEGGFLAYVLYTSGSTGEPKGVAVPHAAVDRLLEAGEALFGFGPGDTWTLFHSYAFDFSVWEMWGALAFGGRLVALPEEAGRVPGALARLLAEQQVTVLDLTPTAFRELLAGGPPPPSLAWVLFGGEALDPGLTAAWCAASDGLAMVNLYGITETTVHVTHRRLAASDRAGTSPIGRPLPDLSLHVLDPLLAPVPPGVAGELAVGGAGLARGYLGRPDLTAARFVPDPFAREAGARLYLSGDLGRRLADGSVDYLGRRDRQVQVRGFRIEPGEIEAALALHPGVTRAVVGLHGQGEAARLVAWWVPAPGEAPDVAALRSFLRERLPEPFQPASFVALGSFPLTANGKLDRTALPPPAGDRPDLGRAYQAPRNAVEEVVAGVWKSLLGLERVGIHDEFFDLGGHSLLATQVLARLEQTFRRPLSLRDTLTATTVEKLAARLTEGDPKPGQSERIAQVVLRLQNLDDREVARLIEEKRHREAGSLSPTR